MAQRSQIRLLFDEMASVKVAKALSALDIHAAFIGRDGQLPKGHGDEEVLASARQHHVRAGAGMTLGDPGGRGGGTREGAVRAAKTRLHRSTPAAGSGTLVAKRVNLLVMQMRGVPHEAVLRSLRTFHEVMPCA